MGSMRSPFLRMRPDVLLMDITHAAENGIEPTR